MFLVSHDRRFLDNVVTSTLVAEGNGVWREYEGDVQDWLTQSARAQALNAQAAARDAAPAAAAADAPKSRESSNPKRKLSYKEQRELEGLPGQIEALETEQAELEKALANGSLYVSDPALAAQKAARLMAVEEQWMAAMERLETLQAL